MKKKKLIIIGIDGCRPDALVKADTPNIDKLMAEGAFTLEAITNSCSISGPCWTSLQTGVWHDKHKVVNNEFENMDVSEFPHIFNYIKKHDPALKTVSIANWEPVSTPLLKNDGNMIISFPKDELVVDEAVRVISEEEPDAVFLQLDNMDHLGHEFFYGPECKEYIEGLKEMDCLVGKLVNAIKCRKNYENEDWLIITATDHGGIEQRHGGESKEELTIFYILNGQNVVPGKIEERTFIVDVAAIALKHFEIDVSKLDGKPHGLK